MILGGTLVVLITLGLAAWTVVLLTQHQGPLPVTAGTSTFVIVLSGLTATAAIEVAKRLTWARGRFHLRLVMDWVSRRASGAVSDIKLPGAAGSGSEETSTPRDRARARFLEAPGQAAVDEMLVSLRSGDQSDAELFDIPSEQLAARISRLVEAAVRDPGTSPGIYAAFAGADPALLTALAPEPRHDAPGEGSASQAKRRSDADLLDYPAESHQAWKWLHAQPTLAQQLEVAHRRASSAVDQLQTTISRRWSTRLTLAAIVLSGATGGLLSFTLVPSVAAPLILLSVFVGGLVSWTARDVGAGIARWRSR
jgi:hypothetical protein